jgi:dihydroorotase-like cyclic amidohydrolase
MVRGVPVTAETSPRYLALDACAFECVGPYAKSNPPLKSLEDVAALWERMADGTVDTLMTDHSPVVPADKQPSRDDLWTAFPSFPDVKMLTGLSFACGWRAGST